VGASDCDQHDGFPGPEGSFEVPYPDEIDAMRLLNLLADPLNLRVRIILVGLYHQVIDLAPRLALGPSYPEK
jgi:hypothetical protein